MFFAREKKGNPGLVRRGSRKREKFRLFTEIDGDFVKGNLEEEKNSDLFFRVVEVIGGGCRH